MVTFTEQPEDESRVIAPSRRRDEVGVAEERLARMERDLSATLQQQKRLADLGLAVSKIVHDLRNMLASAQLLSDRISAVPDPSVQRFAPKLIAALDRAISFAQSTLAYGKPREAAPDRRLVRLNMVVEDVAQVLGLDQRPGVQWANNVPPDLEVDADPDQLFRVLMNLCRNAIEAMEDSSSPSVVQRLAVSAERTGGVVKITVADTGPGLAAKSGRAFVPAVPGRWQDRRHRPRSRDFSRARQSPWRHDRVGRDRRARHDFRDHDPRPADRFRPRLAHGLRVIMAER